MKKIVKGAIAAGLIFLLAGCRNQVNRDFLNRFVELQENAQATSTFKITDLGFTDTASLGMMGPFLEAALAELDYEMTLQKDADDPTLMSFQVDISAMGSADSLLEGIIAEEQFLLDADRFFNFQLLLSDMTQDYAALQQLMADHAGKFISIESEEVDAEEADLTESLTNLRKGFLDLEPELFTETDEEISVTLGKAELDTLFAPLLAPPEEGPQEGAFTELWGADAVTDVTLTVGKETDAFSADVLFDQVDFGEINKLGAEMDMTFTNNEVQVVAPAAEEIVPQSHLQNLLTPLNEGFSTTGYTEAVFQEVLARVESERDELDRLAARELLNVYQVLLTEEQYHQLEEVVDITSLATTYEYPDAEYHTEGPHSDIGIGDERFNALLESATQYRDNQTKASAQKTLDQYYKLLTKEQYRQLEEALDVETLPE